MMGDGGSYFLGFSLGSISILNYSDKVIYPLFITILLFAIPLIDMFFVILKRILDGNSPFKADRKHIHHRLIRRGYSEKEAIILLLALSQLTFLISIFLIFKTFNLIALLLSISIVFIYFLQVENRNSKIKKEN